MAINKKNLVDRSGEDTPQKEPIDQGTSPANNLVGHDGADVHITERPAWNMGPVLPLLGTLALVIFAAIEVMFVARQANQLDTGDESVPQLVIWLVALTTTVLVLALTVTGFVIIAPGRTSVVQFFGKYVGTVRRTGLSYVMPLTTRNQVSIRVRNFESDTIKVNDSNGNPISIGAIVVWQISDTAQATFAVEQVEDFIHSQADSALRHVASTHPYDGGNAHAPSLSGSTDLVSQELAEEIAARVNVAGLEIIEARISALSYAPEIAQAMLQRQQAAAVIDARETIVEGAVSIVQDAINQLERSDVVELDPERRATMVSNLLVVLCSDTPTQPVVNAGTLYN